MSYDYQFYCLQLTFDFDASCIMDEKILNTKHCSNLKKRSARLYRGQSITSVFCMFLQIIFFIKSRMNQWLISVDKILQAL